MFGKRAHDPKPSTHFRAERFSTINGYYFFSTREQTLEGPFVTRAEAERESQAYVSRVTRHRQQES